MCLKRMAIIAFKRLTYGLSLFESTVRFVAVVVFYWPISFPVMLEMILASGGWSLNFILAQL